MIILEKFFLRNRLLQAEEKEEQRRLSNGDYQKFLFYDELFHKVFETETVLHDEEDPMK